MKLYEILIPANNNNAQRAKWTEAVTHLASGLTIEANVFGAWKDGECHILKEGMTPVRIACKADVLANIILFTCEHYAQKEVFVWVVSPEAAMLRPGELAGG